MNYRIAELWIELEFILEQLDKQTEKERVLEKFEKLKSESDTIRIRRKEAKWLKQKSEWGYRRVKQH